ncbi:hypothetical protein [Erythrobacter rubeus]|uniref:Uncharacterized protein n=1 Tax=Erythrobacter rubeus TaxID=2760803 RepID=A0ABR8KQH4_9SPHN|nr:hypothetical protein [Erythrobacter rubeus]MBD2841468.1 hypothetical protein [Erythrobacter rubeus]
MFKFAFAPATAALAMALVSTPTQSLACNPDDCGKGSLSAEELARDKAEIRRLNREQARYVKRRDAEYAKGWAATRNHEAEMDRYEREMAAWREAVRRCQAGDYRYCAR